MAETSKTITRLLQHSILQLCNEHVGYSAKLQILGVLCLTVDDEQQEIVVKVNNTLKRVSPPAVPTKDGPPVLQPAVASYPPTLSVNTPNLKLLQKQQPSYKKPVESTVSTASPSQALPQTSPTPPSSDGPSRKSHGRKGAHPVKIQHVYDEGELSEEDNNVLTVMPTDPETDLMTTSHTSSGIETSPRPASSPWQPQSGSKRKAGEIAQEEEGDRRPESSSSQGAVSAVRALLRGRSGQNGPQDLSTHRPETSDQRPRGLMLPVVLPQANGVDDMSSSGSDSGHGPTDLSMSDKPTGSSSSPSAFNSELTIKEEQTDNYSYTGYHNNNKNNSSSSPGSFDEDLSQQLASFAQNNGVISSPAITQLLSRTSDGLPTQVPYTLAFTTSTPTSQQSDGLSIQYTSTGPITVGKNGKNVSRPSKNAKVKDIILYDDSSPLNEQRGNRIETDYMLDSFGFEGRKRRRRNQDETLTAEEIAEYLGSLDMSAQHQFTCKYCNEELNDLTQYLQHTLTMHHCYICHQCGKSFTTKSSLLRHRPIHTGMRRFACSICKKTFYRKDKCKAHIKRHLGEGGEKPEVENCDDTLE